MGYDYLDELISGVLQFEEPNEATIQREWEKVFYQPSPSRHILDLIGQTALTEADVLIDLGSGLGHVPLMVSICTPARSTGIEVEATYVERARQCAQKLNLNRLTFIHQDVREADLSTGTVFYLYTPFAGSIQSDVLALLRHEAETRRIRICTYGPCTLLVAEESWLERTGEAETNRIALFRSTLWHIQGARQARDAFDVVAAAPGFKPGRNAFHGAWISVTGRAHLNRCSSRQQKLHSIFRRDNTAHSDDRNAHASCCFVDHAQSDRFDRRP
jgi:hypothetical protein